MLIDCDNTLIAEWMSIEDVLPYVQYKAGTKDGDNTIYSDKKESTSNPILALDFDILNKDGFGLKKGFYEIATDEDYTYLMFVQSGEIRAKIPILKQEVIASSGTDYEWPDDKDKDTPTTASRGLTDEITVASKRTYRKTYTEKELKRRKKKYQKGADPITYFRSKVYIEYDRENNLYKVIWEKYNTRLIGIIKVE